MNKLDLHGIRHEDVDRVVENFVLLHDTPMRIVTGNSDIMTKLVLDVLSRHNIEYEKFASSHITILK